jgi:hypothetical protein
MLAGAIKPRGKRKAVDSLRAHIRDACAAPSYATRLADTMTSNFS